MHEGIHISLAAHTLFEVLGVPITNTTLMGILVSAVLIAGAAYLGKNIARIPGRAQACAESILGSLIGYVEEILGSRELALRYVPLLTTLFLFILLGNWFELVPGVESLLVTPATSVAEAASPTGVAQVPLFHPLTTDLNTTIALALIVFVVIEAAGVRAHGLRTYLGKFFNFRSVLGFFVGIIELISEFARLISFSFRLFGNMFAGSTLIMVMVYFAPYLAPVPLMLYEVLVGVIQAAVFTLLTLFFIKLAVSEAH